MNADIVSCFGCFKEVSKSVQVLLNGREAVMVLTLIILKQRALLQAEDSLVLVMGGSTGYPVTQNGRTPETDQSRPLKTEHEPVQAVSSFSHSVKLPGPFTGCLSFLSHPCPRGPK